MLDGFHEQLVTHQSTPRDFLLRLGMVLGSFLGAILLIFIGRLLKFNIMGIFSAGAAIVFGIRAAALYKWEYEYIATAGDLDIDKISAQRNRKRIISFRAADCEIIAPYGRGNYKASYDHLPPIDCTANLAHPNNYFAVFQRAGIRNKVVFQPSEAILSHLKQHNPKHVFID